MPREMTRRYLTVAEVRSALSRGKAVEAFIGGCRRAEEQGVRWVQIRSGRVGVELHVFESADRGSEDFVDVYEFGPLDSELDQDAADEVRAFQNLEDCLVALEERWPFSVARLTNQSVVQDEYADYVRRGRDA